MSNIRRAIAAVIVAVCVFNRTILLFAHSLHLGTSRVRFARRHRAERAYSVRYQALVDLVAGFAHKS